MYTIDPPGPATRLRPGEPPSIGRDHNEDVTRTQAGTVDLIDALNRAWRSICAAYDVTAELPEIPCLFDSVEPKMPTQAAEAVVANMLLEVMEEVGRFSPAYKKPIGLIHVRDRAHDRSRWMLSPETRQRWQAVLTPLAVAIERNTGLLLAADVLGDLFAEEPCDGLRAMAQCGCYPPHVILINRAALVNSGIVCEECGQPFHLLEPPDGG